MGTHALVIVENSRGDHVVLHRATDGYPKWMLSTIRMTYCFMRNYDRLCLPHYLWLVEDVASAMIVVDWARYPLLVYGNTKTVLRPGLRVIQLDGETLKTIVSDLMRAKSRRKIVVESALHKIMPDYVYYITMSAYDLDASARMRDRLRITWDVYVFEPTVEPAIRYLQHVKICEDDCAELSDSDLKVLEQLPQIVERTLRR